MSGEDVTREYAAAYLAGFIDGEGSISRVDLSKSRVVSIANTDPDLLAFVRTCLDVLGVEYHESAHGNRDKPHWSRASNIRVGRRENIARLAAVVELRSGAKRRRLRDLFSAGWKRVPRPHEDDLRRLYAQGHSLQEIAETYGVAFSTARKWLVDLGIERRTTGGGKATSRARKKAMGIA